VLLLFTIIEAAWQLAIGAALDHGASEATRFGITGAAVPPGMFPPPATRDAAILAVVIDAAGGMLQIQQLTLVIKSYPNFSSVGQAQTATAGAGTSGQIVQYTLTYRQPFLTSLAATIVGSAEIVHRAVVTVQNEPFAS
jgi:hypothetical protein